MSKRKLNRRQSRRIDDRQARQGGNGTEVEQTGLVIASHRARLIVEDEHGHSFRCHARQNLEPIVCGDRVRWQKLAGDEGVVTALLPRHSLLTRPVRHGGLKPVAANIDQIFVVFAPEPRLQPLLIDRYLVASELAGIPASLVLNKIDLLGAGERQALERELTRYRALDYPVLPLSSHSGQGLKQLLQACHRRTSILAGQSGVGKSSLIKALLPDIDIQIGHLSAATRLGRHTTSASRLYHLPDDGAIIDSPGVRDFGLWQLQAREIARGFREFQPWLGHCKFSNCQHRNEPGCAIRQAVAEGHIAPERLKNYHRIVHDAL